MKSESTTRAENLADLRKIKTILQDIETAFDEIIANAAAAHENKQQDVAVEAA